MQNIPLNFIVSNMSVHGNNSVDKNFILEIESARSQSQEGGMCKRSSSTDSKTSIYHRQTRLQLHWTSDKLQLVTTVRPDFRRLSKVVRAW